MVTQPAITMTARGHQMFVQSKAPTDLTGGVSRTELGNQRLPTVTRGRLPKSKGIVGHPLSVIQTYRSVPIGALTADHRPQRAGQHVLAHLTRVQLEGPGLLTVVAWRRERTHRPRQHPPLQETVQLSKISFSLVDSSAFSSFGGLWPKLY